MKCKHYELRDGAAADWCRRYVFHVDRAGRFCKRCNEDASFRAILLQQAAVRVGPDCADSDASGPCPVFHILTDPAQCARCKSDPLFRAFLRGQGTAQQAVERDAPCPHRGETLRTEERACCNGRIQQVQIFRCTERGEAHENICRICHLRFGAM